MLPNRFVRWMLISLALLLAFAPFAPASAVGKPTRIPWLFEPFRIDSAVCGFPVDWGKTVDKGYRTDFTDKNGTVRWMITGVLKLTFTNVDTGKSIEVVNPSQYTEVDYPDGSWTFAAHGPSTWLSLPPFPGLPALAYVKGNVSASGDAGGILTFNHTGNVLDVCAALR